MVSHNANLGRGSKGPRFVKLEFYLLNSPAWQDLSHPARSLYVELSLRFNGINNGFISYSVREAADRLRIGKNTAAAAFQELERHGFIKARQKGAFDYKHRHATEWILTEHDYPTGKAATKDFMRWQHPDTA